MLPFKLHLVYTSEEFLVEVQKIHRKNKNYFASFFIHILKSAKISVNSWLSTIVLYSQMEFSIKK